MAASHTRPSWLSAVAGDDEHAVALALILCGKRMPPGNGNALAQRAGVGVHTRGLAHIGMALQMAVELAQRPEVLRGKYPLSARTAYSAGQAWPLLSTKRSVLPSPGWRVHLHYIIIERHQHLHARQRAARMAGFCEIRHLHDVGPQLLCFFLLQCKFLSDPPFFIFTRFRLTVYRVTAHAVKRLKIFS